MRRLSCSDARVIELVGMKMKNNAWDWFQRHIEDQLYGGNPPTWEMFREAVMDEFISPAERQNRACHAPNPGPTRLADLNRFPGRETQDWDFFFFFFFKQNWHLWVWPTSYNRTKI